MGCYHSQNKRSKKIQDKSRGEQNDQNNFIISGNIQGIPAGNDEKLKNNNLNNAFDIQNSVSIKQTENNKIKIIVPLANSTEKWEKEYEQDIIIENVINDYISENNIDIPEDYFLKWNYNNKPLEINSKLSTLLLNENDNNNFIIINNELVHKPLEIDIYEDDYSPEIVGKFFNNPYQIYAYDIYNNTFIVQNYSQEIISNTELNIYYNSTCSYCNGQNNLYISGGLDKDGNCVDKLWIINLKNENIEGPIIIPAKYNHTMLYIPYNYIFFVGGNDLTTFYYNINDKKINEWGNLNFKRIEPALIKIKNYLYCFDNVIKNNENNKFSFEKTDLCSNEHLWELVYPDISDNIEGKIITQKFFGVSTDEDNNIIFLGGDSAPINDLQIDYMRNYRYNIDDNNIEYSVVPYVNFNLKEKCFMSFKNKKNVAFILPNFNNQRPEVIFFVKDRNVIKVSSYLANTSNKDEKNKRDLASESKNNEEFGNLKYDFNMPKFT